MHHSKKQPRQQSNLNTKLAELRLQANLSREGIASKLNVGEFLIDAIELHNVDVTQVLSIGQISQWKHACNVAIKQQKVKALLEGFRFSWAVLKNVWQLPIQNFVLAVTVVGFITLYCHYFEYDDVSVRVYYITLMAIALIGKSSPNILATTGILSAPFIPVEIIFVVLPNIGLEITGICYAILILIWYKLRHDSLFIAVGLTIMISLGAEVYWVHTDYDSPQILWYLFLIVTSLAVRQGITKKNMYIEQQDVDHDNTSKCDFAIIQIQGLYILVCIAMLLEYLLRHVANINSMVIYNIFSQFSQTTGAIIVLILIYSIRSAFHAKRFNI